jgi:IrrE N-terminal-like domain
MNTISAANSLEHSVAGNPSIGQLARLIDSAAATLLRRAGILHPPIDPIDVARRLGFDVVWDANLCARGRFTRVGRRESIFLRPDERPERFYWAAAHELGESCAWKILRELTQESSVREKSSAAQAPAAPDDWPDPELREQIANLFAARLLLPAKWFLASARDCRCDLLGLKRIYSTVSHELIAWRLLDLNELAVVSIFDQGRLSRRRGNLLGDCPPPPLEFELGCWRAARESTRPVERHEGNVRVQVWPVYEPGWRREIIRTTFVETAADAEGCRCA